MQVQVSTIHTHTHTRTGLATKHISAVHTKPRAQRVCAGSLAGVVGACSRDAAQGMRAWAGGRGGGRRSGLVPRHRVAALSRCRPWGGGWLCRRPRWGHPPACPVHAPSLCANGVRVMEVWWCVSRLYVWYTLPIKP